jgi:hypothetical protein
MSNNILNDISKVYLDQVVYTTEALDPVGQEDDDIDNDGKKNTKFDKYLQHRRDIRGAVISKRKKVSEELKGNQAVLDKAPPYGKLTAVDFKELRKRKKRVTKEGYSNWRQDLSEIVNKDQNETPIKEKKVENKIIINPPMKIGEAVFNLGGELIEMVEFEGVLDEFHDSELMFLSNELIEEVVEEFFYECLEEGYEIAEVEDMLIESIQTSVAILNEAKVTYGHDTKIERKNDKLEKVKSAVKKVGKAVARGAGYVAGAAVRGAKAVGREFKSGYDRGRYGSSTTSTPSSSGSESSSSGSSSSGSSRPGLLGRIGSALKRGLKKVVAKGARAVSRGARNIARKMEGGTNNQSEVSKSDREQEPVKKISATSKKKTGPIEDPWGSATTPSKPKTSSVRSGTSRRGIELRQKADEILRGLKSESHEENIPELRSRTITDASSSGGSKKSRTSSVVKMMRQMNADVQKPKKKKKKTVAEESLLEKTLTSAETKKKEEIVKSMKSKLQDFEKRYPGRGKEVMYATATKMSKKVAESFIDEAKLSRTERRARQAENPSTPRRPRHLVQLDLDQAALGEVGSKKLRDPKTGKKQTTKVEPAKINVKGEGGEVVRTVSTGDFHKEKLGKGETMDFSPLRDSKKFTQTTKANPHVVNKARGAVVEPNTARGAFRREEISLDEKVDNKSVLQHLQNIGYNKKRGMDIKPGHFTGDMPGSGSPGKKLKATLHDIKKYQPQKVSHIDDDPKNLEPLEQHRRSTQGERGETRGSDPKIHTQHVGSYRKRGESRTEPREHGRVRRYSGVRDPENVNQPQTTQEIQRRRQRARRGMGEAIDMNQQQPTTQTTKSNPAEVARQKQLVQIQKKQTMDRLAQLNKGVPVTSESIDK